jgi:threonine aldolase
MAACQRWEAVICTETAHVHCDEGGAPEKAAGLKLWPVACAAGDGKLTPAALASALVAGGPRDNVHRAQPGAVTIANTTEMGTVYSAAEVRALADAAHAAGLVLHMDGARLANAAAALRAPLRAFTTDAGVDILSLGGTKIGGMGAEAVVLLPRAGAGAGAGAGALAPALAAALPFLRKTFMQLGSKMRFISAQLLALYEPRQALALRLAAHANAMASRLEAGLQGIPGVRLPTACAANAVFPVLPPAVTAQLRKKFRFYTWDEATGQLRWMCSWDTTESSVDELLDATRAAMAAHAAGARSADADAGADAAAAAT